MHGQLHSPDKTIVRGLRPELIGRRNACDAHAAAASAVAAARAKPGRRRSSWPPAAPRRYALPPPYRLR